MLLTPKHQTRIGTRNARSQILSTQEEQLSRWREHSFKEVLNGEPPTEELQVKQNQEELDINVGEITKGEVLQSIKSLKNGKAGGVDNIPPEAFKAGDSVSA